LDYAAAPKAFTPGAGAYGSKATYRIPRIVSSVEDQLVRVIDLDKEEPVPIYKDYIARL
jgi:hypothetical protein